MRRLSDIRHYLLPALTLFLLTGCMEDDVEEIFCSGTWYVVDYYTDVDWGATNDTSAEAVNSLNNSVLSVIRNYTINFNEDGTLTGNIQNGTYSGYWSADPDGRTVSITRLSATVSLSGNNKTFIEYLEECAYYEGNSRTYLRLAPSTKDTCIQFTHSN